MNINNNKNILITGSSSGLGKNISLYLSNMGHKVFSGVRKQTDADQLIKESNGKITPIIIDLSEKDTIQQAFLKIQADLNSNGLDVLINNAGIGLYGPLEYLEIDQLKKQIDINVFGHLSMIQEFMPLLKKAKGRIINVGSIAGRVMTPFNGPYGGSKFLLRALTDSLNMEFTIYNIPVILIEPGVIKTPMWEKSINMADDTFNNLPDEGKEVYMEKYHKFKEAAIGMLKNATDEEKIVKKVSKIINSKKPKTNYLIGTDAKMTAILVKLMSKKTLHKLLLRSFKYKN